MLFSMWLSFTKWDVITPQEFIGIKNYVNLFKDPLVIKSLKVTAYYTLLSVPLVTCIPLLIAMLLNTKVKGAVRIPDNFLYSFHCAGSGKLRHLDVYL